MFKILNALLLRNSLISPTETQAQVCKGTGNTPCSTVGKYNQKKKGKNEYIHLKNDCTLLHTHFILIKSREQTTGQMERKKKVRVVLYLFLTLYILVLCLIIATAVTSCLF